MKPIIKELREITDSKEMYESKPQPFIAIFIYTILALIIMAGIWAYFGEMDIVSKGIGVVRPNTHLSSIRSKTAGEIEYWNLEEGQKVQKGDILFTVNHDDLDISCMQAKESLLELERQGNSLKKLKKSVEEGKNLFSKENEREDYERYLKYEQDFKELQNLNTIEAKSDDITAEQTEINQSIYGDKITQSEAEYRELEEYKASINAEENLFSNSSSAKALEFKAYLYEVQALRADRDAKREAYELNVSLNEEGLVAEQELTNSKVALELAENEIMTLKNKYLTTIESQIEQTKKEIEGFKQEASKLSVDHELINQKNEKRELSLKTYKTNYLVDLYDQINENEVTYKAQKKELEAIELSIKNCEVSAPIDGSIHIVNQMTVGDLIAVGDNIATIIPTEDNLYTIEIFVPNSEIAGLKVGDRIKYKFDALPYKEYGELEGEITNISTDAQFSETYGISGYIVEGSIVNQTVYSYKNEAAEIKVGMTCEAHVITEQKKILYYLLEKINLKD
nr:HlyD family efflux transporter periplasmic adaptor subunit [uncultured Cellulosilyticum sp.]